MLKAPWALGKGGHSDTDYTSSDEDEGVRLMKYPQPGLKKWPSSMQTPRTTVINPRSMMNLFWMDKKREYKTQKKVMERVERSINQVKQAGKLDLSRKVIASAITLAMMSQQQQDTVFERYGTYDVSPIQIMYMNLANKLQDKGSSKTLEMARWLADNAPEKGRKLADL